jgi:hypothetical protein
VSFTSFVDEAEEVPIEPHAAAAGSAFQPFVDEDEEMEPPVIPPKAPGIRHSLSCLVRAIY